MVRELSKPVLLLPILDNYELEELRLPGGIEIVRADVCFTIAGLTDNLPTNAYALLDYIEERSRGPVTHRPILVYSDVMHRSGHFLMAAIC